MQIQFQHHSFHDTGTFYGIACPIQKHTPLEVEHLGINMFSPLLPTETKFTLLDCPSVC